jgi:hypothetical protein
MEEKEDREKKKKKRRGTRGRTGRERRRINQKMEMKWRTGRKIREKKGRRMRSVRRWVRLMGIRNVDETNLESFLSSSTSILEGPVPRPRW